MRNSTIGSLCVVLAASMGHASAQSINIDMDVPTGPGSGVPSSGLAAGGVQGVWNAGSSSSTSAPLVDVAGAPTGATFTNTGGSGFSFDNPATAGDDALLLDDAVDPGQTCQCTIANLQAGVYTVLTYAWAPDSAIFETGVSVNGGPVSSVGGVFSGTYVEGTTHARDVVTVGAGGSITITLTIASAFATFNGVQIVKQPAGAPIAFCGTTIAVNCPCNTIGAQLGHGCPNSLVSGGALLASTGTASLASDTLVLSGSGMPWGSTCLYLQATLTTQPVAFGDGLRCLGGTLTRLAVRTNPSGTSAYPSAPEPPISVRGGATVGAVLGYQVLYRDAFAFCTSATFNMTNGMVVAWAP